MKNRIKSVIALAVVLLISSTAMAKKAPVFEPQVGDTVVMMNENSHYLTGEKPSKWVYGKRFQIQQIGTKRFPNGLLLKGILSWIDGESVNYHRVVEDGQLEDITETVTHELHIAAHPEDTVVVKPDTVPAPLPEPEPIVEEVVDTLQPIVEEVLDTLVEKDTTVQVYSRMSKQDRFSIGIRGGVASLMHDAAAMGSWKAGFDGLLDLQYAHYFGRKDASKKANLGIITGLSIGWAQSGLQAGVDTTYTVNTTDGNIDYSISAQEVKEKDGQLQLEIPILFSVLTKNGFFFNVGPKLVVPVYKHYNQNIQAPSINAYFEEEGVTVSNEVITGLVQDDQLKTKGKWNSSKINIMLTAELGYEALFKNGQSLGVGVYANYSVYDLYKNATDNKSLIAVTAPAGGTPAGVNVLSATDTYAKGLGYFDCGLKLVYHFNFYK